MKTRIWYLTTLGFLWACSPQKGPAGPIVQEVLEPELAPIEFDEGHPGCAKVRISAEEAAFQNKSALYGPGSPPLTVFLNRHGGTYYPGSNDSARNRSSIIGRARTIPAFERSDEAWSELVDCVREDFSRFNIFITDVEPSAGNYVEAVIGGQDRHLGRSGLLGIAPYGCRPIEKAVAYIFSQEFGSVQSICKTTSHEIGHTLTLDHEYLCEDPMTYLSGCGKKSFQDVDAWCGEYSRRSCDCHGQKQNSVQVLYDFFGASTGEPPPEYADDHEAPKIALISPQNGRTVKEHDVIVVTATASDDVRLARVELVWDYNNERYGCPLSDQYVDCKINSNGHYEWEVQVSTGRRVFRVRAVDFTGKSSVTEDRTVHLTEDGMPPPESWDTEAPVLSVVSPTNGERRNPRSTFDLVVNARDNDQIDEIQLIWAHTDDTWSCPRSGQYVSCGISGDEYTWSIEVGAASVREYRIRAVDRAGNVTTTDLRNVNISEIVDNIPPTVSLMSPQNGAVLGEHTTITVEAEVQDDIGIDDVRLIWDYNGQKYGCPINTRYVDCEVDGSRYQWKVDVSTGARSFRVTVDDRGGNNAVTEDRTIRLE